MNRQGPVRSVLIFSAFALAFFMSYGLRAVNAVLAPDLTAAFSLSAGDLGAMSSAYFVAFSAMQLPLGIWLDRYGSRRVEAALLLVAAAGACFFCAGIKHYPAVDRAGPHRCRYGGLFDGRVEGFPFLV